MRKGLKTVYVIHRGKLSTAIVRERKYKGSISGITTNSNRTIYNTDVSKVDTSPKKWKNPKWFVGKFPSGNYEAFQSCDEFPYIDDKYTVCFGPLSKSACDWVINGGYNNPNFKTVKDAERLCRLVTVHRIDGFCNVTVRTKVYENKVL